MVLKITLDIIMNIDNAALRSLVQSIQTIHMKDIAGKNMGMVVLSQGGSHAPTELYYPPNGSYWFIK